MSRQLEEKRKALEEEFSEQLAEVSDKAIEVGKQALVIAGGVFVAYQLVKLLGKSKSKKKKKKISSDRIYQKIKSEGIDHDGAETIIIREMPQQNNSHSFWDEMKSEFGAFLLGMAKEKLFDAIERLNKPNSTERDEE